MNNLQWLIILIRFVLEVQLDVVLEVLYLQQSATEFLKTCFYSSI